MAEVVDRLARALIDANSRMHTVRIGLDVERARIGAPLRQELQAERAQIKKLLAELAEAGEIDLERLKAERHAEIGDSVRKRREEFRGSIQ